MIVLRVDFKNKFKRRWDGGGGIKLHIIVCPTPCGLAKAKSYSYLLKKLMSLRTRSRLENFRQARPQEYYGGSFRCVM